MPRTRSSCAGLRGELYGQGVARTLESIEPSSEDCTTCSSHLMRAYTAQSKVVSAKKSAHDDGDDQLDGAARHQIDVRALRQLRTFRASH